MADYASLKSTIQSAITSNGHNEISGELLQQTLLAVVNSLGSKYQFVGVATIYTNPGTPDQNIAYIGGPGTYTNMGSVTIPDGCIGVLKYNGTWTVETLTVGKDYDGYLNIEFGSALSGTTQNNKFITPSGDIQTLQNFIVKSFTVVAGKSYYITGLEKNNSASCGWAVYNGATKVSYGANNIQTSEVVVRIPEGGNTLYVCQPTYGGLPSITVTETSSVIDELAQQIAALESVIGETGGVDIENLDIANYALLISETYTNKVWNNGTLVDDGTAQRNATSLVPIDVTKNIYVGTSGNSDVVFFDQYKNYISTLNGYVDGPILSSQIPNGAKYMAFNYYRSAIIADDGSFYVSTRPYYKRLTSKLYPTKNKIKGTRPVVNILTTDSQETVFKKLVDAFYIEDCDVYFQNGTYTFNSIYYLLRTKYNWGDAFELPLGGNCRYFFNNSTIIGQLPTPSTNQLVEQNTSIFGTHRLDGQSYEMHDGELIANGLIYCVHDEASGGPEPYVHHYENMIMRYNTGAYTESTISKCIGGGTGLAGEVVINGCKFYNNGTQVDISWHGHSSNDTSTFKLFVSNCFFANGIGLHTLATNETGFLFISSSLISTVPSTTGWTVFSAL